MNHYRAIWISDVHLGTSGCQANYLLDFLKHNDAEKIYLVGDIIDGWKMKSGFYWPQSHNDVVQKLLRKARKGARIIYIPGNHDEPGPMRATLSEPPFQICGTAHVGEWLLVMLDSYLHGSANGRLAPSELERLDAALAAHPHRPQRRRPRPGRLLLPLRPHPVPGRPALPAPFPLAPSPGLRPRQPPAHLPGRRLALRRAAARPAMLPLGQAPSPLRNGAGCLGRAARGRVRRRDVDLGRCLDAPSH